jgi:hypothetical protein
MNQNLRYVCRFVDETSFFNKQLIKFIDIEN